MNPTNHDQMSTRRFAVIGTRLVGIWRTRG
jgi:hypothetical protein